MDLFTYLMKKKGRNSSVEGDLFSYLLANEGNGTYVNYTGETINVNNSVKAKMKNWNLGGNTSQEDTPTPTTPQDIHVVKGENNILENEGKNLLNSSSIEQKTKGGIKCTYNEETQEITFNGTCNTDNTIFNFLNEIVEAKSGVTTASIHYVSGSITGYCNFRAFTDNYGGNINFNINDLSNNNKIDYATSYYNETLSRISFRFNAGSVVDNLKIKVMIANTTNTDYEKYKGNNYKVSLSSRNLFDITNCERGYSYNYGSTGVIPTRNVGPSRITLAPENAIPVKPSTKYTFNLNNENFDFAVGELQSDKKTNQDSGWKNGSLTITTKSNTRYIVFNFRKKNDTQYVPITDEQWQDFLSSKGQLELGEQSTPYIPYLNIELCKIGDYQDKIYKSNDKWYLHKEIDKVVLNGSENWATASATDGIRYVCTDNLIFNIPESVYTLPDIYCDKFISESSNNTNNSINGIGIGGSGRLVIYYDLYKNETVANFKNWLSQNNVTVYGSLKTPITTEITDEVLLQQLNELAKAKSFNGQTNITQISEDLPFDLSVDIKTQ